MKLKKLISGFLVFIILTMQISFINFNSFVYATTDKEQAENTNSGKYHYEQLTPEAKAIYNGIYEMYRKGILKTGKESYDLTTDGYISQEQLEDYSKGSDILKVAMNAARYAFYADYPEVFYVNFPKLSLRVTKDAENRYHAKLGTGNYKDYFTQGFTTEEQVTTAVEEFNSVVNSIVEKAQNCSAEEGKNLKVEQMKLVHNEIVNNTGYRIEGDCKEGNEGFISTPYGALVKKEAVCEGYARAFKTVLDRVGIKCILVQGVHQTEDTETGERTAAIAHMWNYVQVGEAWYAVDATLDDPFVRKVDLSDGSDREPGWDLVEGFENTRYFLAGAETMNREHTPLETVEAAGNNVFIYPELEENDYGIASVINENGLLVKFKQEGTETEEYKAGDFYISYNGKGYKENAKDGKYLLMKYHEYKPGDQVWIEGNWAYFDSSAYATEWDFGDHIYITVPNSEYVEFAVTTLAPSEGIAGLTYQGDESDFLAQSGKLYNPNGTYKGKPYIKKQTPAATASLAAKKEYDVDITYDDKLVKVNENEPVGYRLVSTGPTGAEKTVITNFTFDGNNNIKFHIKFSDMFADDGARYTIYLTNLVGFNSGKEPMEITYGAVNQIGCAFRMNKAKNWEVFARPSLLESEDLSMNDWQTKDGTKVSDLLKSRVALVTTRPTIEETGEMNSKLPNKDKILASETYNISLNVCRKYVVKTGHRLRLSLGFPAGYGPEDEGVTFKAYHFKENGEVEEIPCVVTPYGLIVTCDSFSPYAFVAQESDGTEETEKYAVVSAGEGGTISGTTEEGTLRDAGNIFSLAQGETQTITVKADEGYQIETLTVGNTVYNMAEETNKEEKTIEVGYDDIKDNGIINATFVAKTVVEEEEELGETVTIPEATEAQIEMPKTILGTVGREITISPNVTGGTIFKWYKKQTVAEGTTEYVPIEGANSQTYSFIPTTTEDSGEYKLKVTTVVNGVSVEKFSEPCTVTVREFGVTITNPNENIDLANLEPGQEFDVDINISNLQNIDTGIIAILGTLEYDRDIFERKSITLNDNWSMTSAVPNEEYLNEQNLRFIIDSGDLVTEAGKICTIKFKVKDTVTYQKQTEIKVKNVTASGGNGVITAKDAKIDVGTRISNFATTYKIDHTNKYIWGVPVNTTVADLKTNIITDLAKIVKDKEGNVVTDDSIISTGMTIEIGNSLVYELGVIGDINGDGEIDVSDLSQLKLHIIELKVLTGIKEKAADVNLSGEIDIDDGANIKLRIINEN